jgi:hypothetical protein
MSLKLLDNPLVTSRLFYPRRAVAGTSALPKVHDGSIPVAEDVALGYRLYAHESGAPMILYFHGNGEVASDHDMFAEYYRGIGVSLLVVDYRGYGWSSGQPRASALIEDVAPVIDALPRVLKQANLTGEWLYVMGRSLGSAPAIQAAHAHKYLFTGLIIESGFSNAMRLLSLLGVPQIIAGNIPDPVGNRRKIAEIDLPLLLIHGERDTLLPAVNAEELYIASPAKHKHFVRIGSAGHNDLMLVGINTYFDSIAQFIARSRQEKTR